MNSNYLINFYFMVGIIFSMLMSISAQPQIEVSRLNENIYLIPIYSVNTMVYVCEKEAMVIDAGYEQVSAVLNGELTKLGVEKVKYLVNTHWHFDHVGGNKYFGKQAEIVAHSTVRELLSKDEMLLGELQKAYPLNALPDITTNERATIYIDNEEINIIPLTGAHTGGDLIVWFKNANVVHIGDIIFSDMFPFVDVDHGGSTITMAENLKEIIRMFPDDIKIIPGHGRELNKSDVEKYYEMVTATTSIVNDGINNGMSMDEMIEDEILKEWAKWGKSFSCSDWIEMIFYSFNASK